MQDVISSTAELVREDGNSYLKLSDGDSDRIVSCTMIDFNQAGGNQSTTPAVFTIAKYSDQMLKSLEPNAGLINFHLVKGVLYALPATVVECTVGQPLRVKLLLPNQCRGRSLRSSPRYHALAAIRILPVRSTLGYTQLFPSPLNISMGGFGLQTRDADFYDKQKVNFEMKLYVDENGVPSRTAPMLELAGSAEVTNVMQLDSENSNYCGFRFVDLPRESEGPLAFWLKTHEAMLRSS